MWIGYDKTICKPLKKSKQNKTKKAYQQALFLPAKFAVPL